MTHHLAHLDRAQGESLVYTKQEASAAQYPRDSVALKDPLITAIRFHIQHSYRVYRMFDIFMHPQISPRSNVPGSIVVTY